MNAQEAIDSVCEDQFKQHMFGFVWGHTMFRAITYLSVPDNNWDSMCSTFFEQFFKLSPDLKGRVNADKETMERLVRNYRICFFFRGVPRQYMPQGGVSAGGRADPEGRLVISDSDAIRPPYRVVYQAQVKLGMYPQAMVGWSNSIKDPSRGKVVNSGKLLFGRDYTS